MVYDFSETPGTVEHRFSAFFPDSTYTLTPTERNTLTQALTQSSIIMSHLKTVCSYRDTHTHTHTHTHTAGRLSIMEI